MMDESLLFGNDDDTSPTSAEAAKRIAEMTQDLTATLNKPVQVSVPTPRPVVSNPVTVPTPAANPIAVAVPTPPPTSTPITVPTPSVPVGSINPMPTVATAQHGQFAPASHPSVIGQIASQPVVQKPAVNTVPHPGAKPAAQQHSVPSTIPESTKLQELFTQFRGGKMTKEVFNNSVISLFGRDRGTEILIQMDKRIAAATGGATPATTAPVTTNPHQIKMGQMPPTPYRVPGPGVPNTVPTQASAVSNAVIQQHMLQKMGAGGVTGVAPVNVNVQAANIARPVVSGTIPTALAKPAAAAAPPAAATPAKKKDDDAADDEKPSIKDLNDVTKIAGVDLRAEEEGSLSDVPDDPSQASQVKEAEPMLLNDTPLKRKVLQLTQAKGMKVTETIFPYLSAAVADQLRSIIEGLVRAADHRLEAHKDDYQNVITSDPRKILSVIERREREEKSRKDAEEKEKILKEAKQQEAALKKKQDDKQSVALREKLSKVRAEEEDRIRTNAANETALAAIGDIGKKKPPSILSMTTAVPPPPATTAAPTTPGAPPMAGTAVAKPAAPTTPGAPTTTAAVAKPAPTAAAAAQQALVTIPPQGFTFTLPNGQQTTFTQNHLATLRQLVTAQRGGRVLSPHQIHVMNTLLAHYQQIQRIQASQAQATAVAMDAKGKQQRRIIYRDCLFLQKQIGPHVIAKHEKNKVVKKAKITK